MSKQDKLQQAELDKHLSKLENGELGKEGSKKSRKQRQEVSSQGQVKKTPIGTEKLLRKLN